jgi:CHASE3 domain sensor protein
MLAASLVLAVLVGSVLTLLVLTINGFRHTAQRVRHSEEVIASANHLEKQVLDLETGERGFMLTRRERFLEPWRSAGRQLPVGTARLERLVAGDRDQEQRARGIARATHSYYVGWSAPIVRLARRHPAAATAKVSSGEGKRRVDAIRGRFERFTAPSATCSTTAATRPRQAVAGRSSSASAGSSPRCC